MKDARIAFFDSGVGGIPYLSRMSGLLPESAYYYCADTANFPYGTKLDDLIRSQVLESVGRLIDTVDPQIVVVACNTASVVALQALRERFPIPFIGVVPAVKPAARISSAKRIGLLATSRTVAEAYTENLIRTYAQDSMVFRQAGTALVEFVEHRFPSASPAEPDSVLKDIVCWCVESRIDVLILGCTHFVFLRDHLSRLLEPGITILDSVEGVVNQAVRVLAGVHLESSDNRKTRNGGGKRSERLFFETGTQGASTAILAYCRMADLSFAGTLPASGREGADGSVACIRETGA